MSPFCQDLAQPTDYLRTASNLRKVVVGDARTGYGARVRGNCPDDGAEVGVAYYEIDYPLKADAAKRATELLRHVKALRGEGRA